MTIHPNLKGGNFSLVHNLMYENLIFNFIPLVIILHEWHIDDHILSHDNFDQLYPEKPTSTSDHATIVMIVMI